MILVSGWRTRPATCAGLTLMAREEMVARNCLVESRLQKGDDGAPDLRVVVQEADQADQRVAGQPGYAGQHG